jgi:hypothetical protein
MQQLAANPVRLVALVGVLAVLGGGMVVFKSTQGTASSETAAPTLLHTSAKGLTHHKPVTKPRHVTKPHKAVVKHHPAVAKNGYPWVVAHALVKNPVVVVAIVSPNSDVDDVALSEAKAGAEKANAAFVQVNAYQQSQIGPLASKVQITGNPAILVMKRPTVVSIQIAGFADRQSIAQAVDDARYATATTSTTPAATPTPAPAAVPPAAPAPTP